MGVHCGPRPGGNTKYVLVEDTGVDPYFNDISLLLHMDGTDGSTTFTDSSSNGYTVGAVGSAQIDAAQSKFGGASGLFQGSNDYLTYPAVPFDFLASNTDDFTLEFWVRFNSVSGLQSLFIRGENNVSQRSFVVYKKTDHTLRAELRNDASKFRVDSTATFSAGAWYHVAVVVTAGNQLETFIDGVSQGAAALPSAALTATLGSQARIGVYGDPSLSFDLNGWLDDLRITKGVARYTSNFTPPTEAFPNS